MRIVLVRHAAVQFSAGKWIWPRGVPAAVANYNRAPILPTEVPYELKSLVHSGAVVLASSLARSVHTADLLARGSEYLTDSIYDEAELPSPRGAFPVLPIWFWFIVLRTLWLLGWADGAEPKAQTRRRAQLAAERLVHISEQNELVVLIGHGIHMAFISRALERMGWCRLGSIPKQPWSACCFLPFARTYKAL